MGQYTTAAASPNQRLKLYHLLLTGSASDGASSPLVTRAWSTPASMDVVSVIVVRTAPLRTTLLAGVHEV